MSFYLSTVQVNFNLGRALQEKGLRGEATKAYERAMKEYEACGETDQADYEETPKNQTFRSPRPLHFWTLMGIT